VKQITTSRARFFSTQSSTADAMRWGSQMVVTSVARADLGLSVAEALRGVVEGQPPGAALRVVICALRNSAYSLAQFLQDCASTKDEAFHEIDNSEKC
jgi:hypothetical protein